MSHIVSIQTKVTDFVAVNAASARLGLEAPVVGTAELYSGNFSGMLIRLPGWHYPAVADLTTGELKFDNYGGAWGEQAELDRFLQAYAIEKIKLESRGKGYAVNEEAMSDGSVKLEIIERN